MDHKGFLRQVVELSREKWKEYEGGPFAALVVKDGAVVGRGWNRVTGTNDPTAHAEVVAIRDACRTIGSFSLEGAVIYSSSEPCPMCLAAIYWARLEKVYHANAAAEAAAIGFDDAFLYEQFALPSSERSLPVERLFVEGALDVFEGWVADPDTAPY